MKFSVIFLIFSLLSFFNKNEEEMPYSRIITKLDGMIINKICQEKGYSVFMIGGGAVNAITLLSFGFEVKEEVDITRAREIYLDALDELSEVVNSNIEARPYLMKYPIDLENLSIMMRFQDGGEDSVVLVLEGRGSIYYEKRDEGDVSGMSLLYKETYEEALERRGSL